jgi:hypothetical protein
MRIAHFLSKTSVADPECLSRIQDPNFSIPDPGQKGDTGCLSWIRIFFILDPDFFHPGSRGGKHWIPDADPQNCQNIGLCDFELNWLIELSVNLRPVG